MRRFLTRLFRTTVDTTLVAIVVGGFVVFALVLLFKLVGHVSGCPEGEHIGPGGFPTPVCESDELLPHGSH